MVWGSVFGVWGVGFGVWGLGFGVWGLGFAIRCLWCGVWGLGLGLSDEGLPFPMMRPHVSFGIWITCHAPQS